MTTGWGRAQSEALYNMNRWSDGLFSIDDSGQLCVALPDGQPQPLLDMIDQLSDESAQLPVLLRFPQILQYRVRRLHAAFTKAMSASSYKGDYCSVYPIKVNQQKTLLDALVEMDDIEVGLEAGSKAELLAILATGKPKKTRIICNGYKDAAFIRLALSGQKLGFEVYIVVEKPAELSIILEQSRLLNVKPCVGLRMRLQSIAHGQWQNSGGAKAKFGLTAAQVLDQVELLIKAGQLDCLKLLHFHMGSQISNVADICTGMQEAVRYYAELSQLGASIEVLDVGGGLAVDYEGTGTRHRYSMNYGFAEYAHTIIKTVKETCALHKLTEPAIFSESGRGISAHHAVLITEVSSTEYVDVSLPKESENSSRLLNDARKIMDQLESNPRLESFHQISHLYQQAHQLFIQGQINLKEKALLDQYYFYICSLLQKMLNPENRSHREVLDELQQKLADKYFCNFSVFRSIPDSWAIDQVFPVMPLQRLDEQATRRAVLEDLTCDSDGRVDEFVQDDGLSPVLAMHELKHRERYLLGFFLVGAYQEVLGDDHNLFGVPDVVNVQLERDQFKIMDVQKGARIRDVLKEVGYVETQVLNDLLSKLDDVDILQKDDLKDRFERALVEYTYLSIPSEQSSIV